MKKNRHSEQLEENLEAQAEILRYLDEHGIECKDRDAPTGPKQMPRQHPKPAHSHHTLDLHGMTVPVAERAIRAAVDACRESGRKSLLVIHGAGHHSDPSQGPVLGALVRQMLDHELSALVSDYRKAPPPLGGGGATVVILR
jgi:DNA-nicking Smr family endonuclease